MDTQEILKVLPQLSNGDRLKIAQEALRLTTHKKDSLTPEEIEQHWSIAATEALGDYSYDKELTAFTALDSEPFHVDNSKINE